MIDPKDVRVGNWLLKITGIDENNSSFFEYKPIAIDEYFFTFAKVCFPIKITPAVLGNCGFKHEFGDWYKNIDADGIEDGLPLLRLKKKDGNWYFRENQVPAQPVYLHQLQNLFYALSKTELNVRLEAFENIAMMGPINFFVKPLQNNPQ